MYVEIKKSFTTIEASTPKAESAIKGDIMGRR
jgi:hypothetical protein